MKNSKLSARASAKKQSVKPKVVLSLSGSDPSGGAGQEADLKAYLRHGVYGLNLTTLLTVQNSLGVQAVHPLDPDFLERQWKALFADIPPDVIKIGALGALPMVERVAKLLNTREARHIPVVLDPVLGSTSGSPLLAARALSLFKRKLLPRCRVVTPNLPEFETLFGPFKTTVGTTPVEKLRSLEKLPYAILLKGGHADGPESIDWLWDNGRLTVFRGKRLPAKNAHGTGCTLSAAIAACLGWGASLDQAVATSKRFVEAAIREAPGLGHGQGPLNHNVGVRY